MEYSSDLPKILSDKDLGDILGNYWEKFNGLPVGEMKELVALGVTAARNLHKMGERLLTEDNTSLGEVRGLERFHLDAVSGERRLSEFPAAVIRGFVDLAVETNKEKMGHALKIYGGVPYEYVGKFRRAQDIYKEGLVSVDSEDGREKVWDYLKVRDEKLDPMGRKANEIGEIAVGINTRRTKNSS